MPLTLTRSLVVVLVPGIVAVAPWLLLGAQLWPGLVATYTVYETPENAMLFALVVVLGAFFEGLASHIEARWDKQREQELVVKENWYAYLSRTEPEPVGHRYISRMVTTLYFELAMLFASFVFFLGVAALAWLSGAEYAKWWAFLVCLLAVGSAFYFWWQARCSHKVLCEVRRELNNRPRPRGQAVEQGENAESAG